MVKPFTCQVCPHRAVFFLVEEPFLKSFHNLFFSFKISVRFIVDLIEAHSHLAVSLVKPGIYPIVHHCPQGTHFRIARFPFHQHFPGLIHQRRGSFRLLFRHTFLHQGSNLRFVMFIKSHVVITYQMVSLFAGTFGSFTIPIKFPSKHRLTNMDTAVVYNISLHKLITISHDDISQCIAQQVIAHMSQVKRLVRIG